MKVLIVNNCLPNSGIGQYTDRLHAALQKLDNEIDVNSWESVAIEKAYRRVRNHLNLSYFQVGLRAASQAYFTMRLSKNYSLYHITSSSFSMASNRLKPFVVTVHDMIQFSSPRWWGDVLIRPQLAGLTKAECVICVSQYTKSEVIRFLEVDPGIIRVIYNGIDHEQFKPGDKLEARQLLGLDRDKAIVLHVGSEEPRKNIPTLIRAFAKFREQIPNAILVRVGERTSVSQRLYQSLGLEANVRYFRDVKNLGLFYQAADMFVFPSSLEGFGFPPLEAMASGCPVVASNKTSIPEVLGDAAVLVDDLDTDGFARLMERVYTNQQIRSVLVENGFQQSKMFSWDKCARETLEVYRELFSKRYGYG